MACLDLTFDGALIGNALVAVATVVAAVVGGVAVWYVNKRIDERNESFEREQQILKALDYFSGGTQSRSAGLGLLEGLLHALPHQRESSPVRRVFLPVLANQLIYLSTSSTPKMEFHEHDNFARLLALWKGLDPSEADKGAVRRALAERHVKGLEFVGDYKKEINELSRFVSTARRE